MQWCRHGTISNRMRRRTEGLGRSHVANCKGTKYAVILHKDCLILQCTCMAWRLLQGSLRQHGTAENDDRHLLDMHTTTRAKYAGAWHWGNKRRARIGKRHVYGENCYIVSAGSLTCPWLNATWPAGGRRKLPSMLGICGRVTCGWNIQDGVTQMEISARLDHVLLSLRCAWLMWRMMLPCPVLRALTVAIQDESTKRQLIIK